MSATDRPVSTRRAAWIELAQLVDHPTARGGSSEARVVEVWLWAVAALVVAIIGVGGATRLTDSGLSITEWQPILGAIPPLGETAWQDAFAKYKLIPQYKLANSGMSLEAFKVIYWWEWGHRQLGRLIGLAYAVPLMVLLAAGMVPRPLIGRLVAIAALIGLQGAVGWYMVQSGLSGDRIAVSPLRLTLHLSIAFLILGCLVWVALGLTHDRSNGQVLDAQGRDTPGPSLFWGGTALAGTVVVLIYLQVVLGGLVAGTRAGLVYNTWPLMDGALVPSGLMLLEPWWRNLIENVTTVQFNHRAAAYLLVAATVVNAVAAARHPRLRWPAAVLLAAVLAQAVLGILTLLSATGGQIPIGLGVAHQVSAAFVFALAILHLSRMMTLPSGTAMVPVRP